MPTKNMENSTLAIEKITYLNGFIVNRHIYIRNYYIFILTWFQSDWTINKHTILLLGSIYCKKTWLILASFWKMKKLFWNFLLSLLIKKKNCSSNHIFSKEWKIKMKKKKKKKIPSTRESLRSHKCLWRVKLAS